MGDTPLAADAEILQTEPVGGQGDEGWEELGVVSPSYLLVHNSKVKDLVDNVAERSKIADWRQRRLFFDGRRFVYCLSTDSISAEVAPGDVIRFGLVAYNSYDGSRALSVGAYAEHLVCSNGMTSDTYFARFVFRHHHDQPPVLVPMLSSFFSTRQALAT